MGSYVRFKNEWVYRAKHRSQRPQYDPRVLLDPKRAANCTIYAGLTWLDQVTQGKVGPGISGQALRARQSDNVGGIGLDDLQEALAKTPGPDGTLLDVGSTTTGGLIRFDDLWRMSQEGRPIIWQGDYDALADAGLGCLSGFGDGHAIVTLGQHDAYDRVIGSDPLCGGFRWYGKPVLRAYETTLPGSRVLVGPVAAGYPAFVRVRPGGFWAYRLSADGVILSRRAVPTKGFSGVCDRRVSRKWAGRTTRSLTVTMRSGAYNGWVINGTGFNIDYREG